jgi:hypothetical protein
MLEVSRYERCSKCGLSNLMGDPHFDKAKLDSIG